MSETVPDGTQVKVSQVFKKTWNLQNAGKVPWTDRYLVRQGKVSGASCVSDLKVQIPDTSPGETVTITVQVTAPPSPAVCHVTWKMTDAQGHEFFPQLTGIWFDVIAVR